MTPDRKIALMRAGGYALSGIMTVITLLFAARWPILVVINASVNQYVGKLLGVPLQEITIKALGSMKPDAAAAVAIHTLAQPSLPAAQASAIATRVLQSLPPREAARFSEVTAQWQQSQPITFVDVDEDATTLPPKPKDPEA